MKQSKHNKLLTNIFSENDCIPFGQTILTQTTNDILLEFYDKVLESYEIICDLQKKYIKTGKPFYTKTVTKMTKTARPIIPPNTGNAFFPDTIKQHIIDTADYMVECNFITNTNRKIKIIFVSEEEKDNPYNNAKIYDNYICRIYLWILFIHNYASPKCSQTLTIYIYLTSLKKQVPINPSETIGVLHVNTAYTQACADPAEIVIYRKEEWFKVLLHESFHNFGLDFANINSKTCVERMLSIFPITSEVNLFESYTEFWAEMLNVVFFCFFKSNVGSNTFRIVSRNYEDNIEMFLTCFQQHIRCEINYSIFQMVKVLNHMGLNYEAIHSKKQYAYVLRNQLYKEESNVFAYYVAKTILLFNFQEFTSWCDKHNPNILQFKQTDDQQQLMCAFIEKHFNTNKFKSSVKCCESLWKNVNAHGNKVNQSDLLLNNLRMTICEHE